MRFVPDTSANSQPPAPAPSSQSGFVPGQPGAIVIDPLRGTAAFIWTFRLCVLGLLALAAWVGGPAVRLTALLAAPLALLGDRSGAIRQVMRLAGLAVAIVAAPPLGTRVGEWIAGRWGMAGPLAVALGVGIVAVLILGVSGLIGRVCSRFARRRRYVYAVNRAFGGLLGVGEGALIAAAACWVLGMFGPPLALYADALSDSRPALARLLRQVDVLRVALEDDPVARWVGDANPLTGVSRLATIEAMSELAVEPGLFWQAAGDGRLDELLAIPVVRKHYEAVRADPRMRQAVKERDLHTILLSRHFAAALNDDELCEAIAAQWPELRQKISASEIARARRAAERVDGAARSQLQRAIRRAEELGVELP